MAIVDLSRSLPASADAIWNAVKTPAAFRKVTRGLLTMPVINRRRDEWHEGETVIGWVFLFGFIPFSHHHLHIAKIDEKARTLSSREQGGLVKRWDHDIIVTHVSPDTCSYRDRIDIYAGVVTPLVVLYARFFYRIRQCRWRALAKGMY
jgi:hypothetical protein